MSESDNPAKTAFQHLVHDHRYFYDFLEANSGIQTAAGQGVMGVAVDGTTMIVNDEFLKEEPSDYQTGYEDYDFYRNTMKRSTGLAMRISHERIHQITFAQEKLLAAADPTNITAVTDLNAQILALAPVEVEIFELKTAKPLGVQIISGVALVSYFETAEGIKTATIGDAMNELFTNHLAQRLVEPNQLVHPLLQKLIDTVGSYEDTVRLYLHSDFLTLQAKYEALHGTGSYLAFLKAVDDLNTIADNLDLARQYGEDKATAKRYEQFKNKLQEIL